MCTLSVIVGLQLVRRLGEPVPKWSTGPTFKNPLRFDQQVLSEILLSRSKVGQRPKSVPLSCSSESLQPVPHREKSHHTFDSIVIIRYPCEKIFRRYARCRGTLSPVDALSFFVFVGEKCAFVFR
jgi:hypothetical protein